MRLAATLIVLVSFQQPWYILLKMADAPVGFGKTMIIAVLVGALAALLSRETSPGELANRPLT